MFSVVAGEVFEAVVGSSSFRMAADDGKIEISGSHIKLSADRIDMK
ncbi:hypothetical protein [Rhodovulum sulfidophilum]|nr:hypothetical protein [Rhodovulum sulfidophilum]MBL3560156.1 hypothetical protein [Rhodovulum sulfidophilum]